MNAADLVITMAGYNTLMDAIALRKRTLVLPRKGPSAEQLMRTEMFVRHGLVKTVLPEQMTTPAVATAIRDGLEREPPTVSR